MEHMIYTCFFNTERRAGFIRPCTNTYTYILARSNYLPFQIWNVYKAVVKR